VSEQAGRYQRSAGGMVGAMAVLVVLVLAWVGIHALTSSSASNDTRTVDYAAVVPAVRREARLDVLAPPRLPAGWRATSTGFTNGAREHWHLGVLTDRDRYVGLEQSADPVRSMVESYVDESAARKPPVDVAGKAWSAYTDAGGDLALVRRDGRTTTLVVGHEVPRATLVSYVASLR
jgi:Protein of unknown function (DUF4245)